MLLDGVVERSPIELKKGWISPELSRYGVKKLLTRAFLNAAAGRNQMVSPQKLVD